MSKKIMFWYHHFGGLGHATRIFSLAGELKVQYPAYDVLVVNGGITQNNLKVPSGVKVVNLPPLRAETGLFKGLKSVSGLGLGKIKEIRKNNLLNIVGAFRPDVLILEHFPFGRNQFNFEIIPLLNYIKSNLPETKIMSSVRDIITQEVDRKKLVKVLEFFSYVLVHSDPRYVRFSFENLLKGKLVYTGYIISKNKEDLVDASVVRDKLGVGDKKLVVVNVGGGIDGFEILKKTILAKGILSRKNIEIKLLVSTGPSISELRYKEVVRIRGDDKDILITKFNPNLIDYIHSSDLSVSMAGYNSFVNSVVTGTNTVFVPRGSDSEQRERMKVFEFLGNVHVDYGGLSEGGLASLMDDLLTSRQSKSIAKIDLCGKSFFVNFIGSLFNGKDVPKRLNFELTSRCNLNCDICHQKGIDKPDLEISDVKKVIDNISPYIRHISFIGGETMVREDFFEILGYLKKKKISCEIATNGVLLNSSIIDKLSKYDVTQINLSLDGFGDLHDELRGKKGLFEYIDSIIDKLCDNFKVMVNCVLREENINRLYSLIDYLRAKKISKLRFIFETFSTSNEMIETSQMGRVSENLLVNQFKESSTLAYSFDDFEALMNNILRLKDESKFDVEFEPYDLPRIRSDIYNSGLRRNNHVQCKDLGVPRIDSQGKLVFCQFIRKEFGNLVEEPFSKIWTSRELIDFRLKVEGTNLLPICERCCKVVDVKPKGSIK